VLVELYWISKKNRTNHSTKSAVLLAETSSYYTLLYVILFKGSFITSAFSFLSLRNKKPDTFATLIHDFVM